MAVHGQRAGDITGVPAVGSGHVHEHHIARLHLAVVLVIMKDRREESRTDDGRVRWPLASQAFEFVLHEGCYFIFPRTGFCRFHRCEVRFHGGVDGAAHEGDFRRRLYRSQACNQGTGVSHGCQWRHLAQLRHHVRLKAILATLRLRRKLCVNLRKPLQRFEKLGLEDAGPITFYQGKSCTRGRVRIIGAEFRPCPFLFPVVVRRYKEDLLIDFHRLIAARTC